MNYCVNYTRTHTNTAAHLTALYVLLFSHNANLRNLFALTLQLVFKLRNSVSIAFVLFDYLLFGNAKQQNESEMQKKEN